jgi:hypothetical protein
MAAGDRAESLRRMVEVTGLGIAATYFLDPEHGAARRRAARRWVAAAISYHRSAEPPLSSAVSEEVAEPPHDAPVEPASAVAEPPVPAHDEVVLVTAPVRVAPTLGREAPWPRWGWALVMTVTLCAVAAFAAVGVGIWAVEKHRSTTTVTTATIPKEAAGAARILADPTARRVVGTATTGRILLRIDSDGGALAVDGLPPLPANELYRVWVTASGTTTAVGSFTNTAALLGIQKPLTSGDRVVITPERPAGSATPRGSHVASVTVP